MFREESIVATGKDTGHGYGIMITDGGKMVLWRSIFLSRNYAECYFLLLSDGGLTNAIEGSRYLWCWMEEPE